MVEKFYEEELFYLYDSGKEFAKAHPDRAQFLNIDAVGDRDPYVERLFEGFAFLAARVREKLDDSFPELTEGLINLLWPHFQKEIPSLTIVEFKPRIGHLQETRILPKGSELISNPVGPDVVSCRFITTQDVILNPIRLTGIDKSVDTKGKGTLKFNFGLDGGAKWKNLDTSILQMYIHAEIPTALALCELLTRHVVSAKVSLDNDRAVFELDPENVISQGGFSPDESLLPDDSRSFRGYALLLEYFVYPEKFLFVIFHGLENAPLLDPSPSTFSITLTFDCDFPSGKPFGQDNFRLSCAPAVNLFLQDTEPIVNTGRTTEYIVKADSNCLSTVVHSIISVVGIDRKTGKRSEYEPFHSFRCIGKPNNRTYIPHYRQGVNNKRELYITIGGKQVEEGVLRNENISIEAWCTNGVLPREELREGSISKQSRDIPEFLMFTNITRPTLPCLPPPDKDYLWVFLSHLGATYNSFSSPDSLKSFIKLYDWSNSEGRSRRIEAICDVSIEPAESLIQGNIVRGIEFSISVQEAEFADTGDLYLFGEVLRAFFSLFFSINSFLELVIIARPSGKQIRLNSLKGKKWPI